MEEGGHDEAPAAAATTTPEAIGTVVVVVVVVVFRGGLERPLKGRDAFVADGTVENVLASCWTTA